MSVLGIYTDDEMEQELLISKELLRKSNTLYITVENKDGEEQVISIDLHGAKVFEMEFKE
jgi:VCBS repeat-containing protein